VTVAANSHHLTAGVKYGVLVTNSADKQISIVFPCQVLSTPARELYRIANPPVTPKEFVDNLADQIYHQLNAKHGHEVSTGAISISVAEVERVADGQHSAEPLYKLPRDRG
jgi:hypothetical protein